MRIYGRIPGDHPFRDFLITSLRKVRGNAKCNLMTLDYYVKISQWWFDVILWWALTFTGLGKLSPPHFNPDLKFPLNFPYNPKFRMDSLHQKPSSPGIPRRIREILSAGQWQFVADLAKRPKITKYLVTHTKQHKYFFFILRIWMMHIEWRTDEELHFLYVPITPEEALSAFWGNLFLWVDWSNTRSRLGWGCGVAWDGSNIDSVLIDFIINRSINRFQGKQQNPVWGSYWYTVK